MSVRRSIAWRLRTPGCDRRTARCGRPRLSRATITALRATSATLLERISTLEYLIEDLRAKLAINSRNSSKPPSSDGPEVAPRQAKKKRGRKPGGQPGHVGTTRAMAPIEQVDVVKDIRPMCCADCGTLLLGEDPAPLRRQVIEIPPPKVIVTEYRLHRLSCVACGCSTQAAAPAGLSPSVFGATVHALAALLVGRFRQSKRLVVELLDVLYGLTLSPGTICAMEQRVSAALEAPVDAALATLRAEEVVGKDETGRPPPHQSLAVDHGHRSARSLHDRSEPRQCGGETGARRRIRRRGVLRSLDRIRLLGPATVLLGAPAA